MTKVTEIYAFFCIDNDAEGVPAIQMHGSPELMPLVCYSKHTLKNMKNIARKVSAKTGKKLTLVKFSQREDIETIGGLELV